MSSTKATVFVKLRAPPHIDSVRPQYCSFNGNCIIVTIGQKLLLYDLDKQTITKEWQSANTFTDKHHGHYASFRDSVNTILGQSFSGSTSFYNINSSCIDLENKRLYALITVFDGAKLISVDLIKNEWNELKEWKEYDQSLRQFTTIRNIFFVPSINELYVDKVTDEGYSSAIHDQYFYRNETKQLFKKHCGKIAVCDVNTDDQSMSEWKNYEKQLTMELPEMLSKGHEILFKMLPFEMILAFDQLIFHFSCPPSLQFRFKKKNDKICDQCTIWCLDLDHNERWYRVRHGMPDFGDAYVTPYAIKDDNNYVHLINFGETERNNYHFRASLFDLIPAEIIKLNRERYDPLIVGFVKDFEKKHKIIFLPMYLKKLIVKFYPIFL